MTKIIGFITPNEQSPSGYANAKFASAAGPRTIVLLGGSIQTGVKQYPIS